MKRYELKLVAGKLEILPVDIVVKKIIDRKLTSSVKEVGKTFYIYMRNSQAVKKYSDLNYFLLSKAGKRLDVFLVDTVRSITAKQQFDITFLNLGAIKMIINYEIKISEYLQAEAVSFFASRESPSEVLEQSLYKTGVSYFESNAPLLLLQENSFKEQFNAEILSFGAANGLDIKVLLEYIPVDNSDDTYKAMPVTVNELQVQPTDYNSFIKLSFSAVLIPDNISKDTLLFRLLKRKTKDCEQILIGSLQAYIRTSVTYREIARNLNSKIRNGILEMWNNELNENEMHLTVGDLKVSVEEKGGVDSSTVVIDDIFLKNSRIKFIANLIITEIDSHDAGSISENTSQALEGRVKQYVQKTAASYRLAEVISDITGFTDRVLGLLNSDLENRGYKAEHLLLSVADYDSTFLSVNLTLQDEDAFFETQIGDSLTVKVQVNGKIKNLNAPYWLENYVKIERPDGMIKQEMRNIIANSILSISPDSFYSTLSGSFSNEIKKVIAEFLAQQMNFEPSVTVHVVNISSRLLERLRKLAKGAHKIDVSVYDGSFQAQIKFSVLDVIPAGLWDSFASRKYDEDSDDEMNNIIEDFRSSLTRLLHKSEISRMINRDELYDVIYEKAKIAVQEVINKRFVQLYVEDVSITHIQFERMVAAMKGAESNAKYKNIMERQDKKIQDISDAKEAGASGEHVRTLECELEDIRKELKDLFKDYPVGELNQLGDGSSAK
jgi:hypothetical protein